jgi:hypothetical protein
MEPDVLVGGKEPRKLGSDNTDDVTQHWDEDHTAIKSEYKTCSTGTPYRVREAVQSGQFTIGFL